MTELNFDAKRLANFWAKVSVKGEDDCWEWTGAKQGKNYGSFAIAPGKSALAHKISWALVKNSGVLSSPTSHIMHSCDNRKCVNPNHLSLGTALDNNRDMVKKGRRVNRIPSQEPFCKRGHPRTPENTDKYNLCKVCKRDINREAKRRERELDREAYNAKHRRYYQTGTTKEQKDINEF
jgi:hypothetical protein